MVVGTNKNAAVLFDLGCTIPVGVDIHRITAGRPDGQSRNINAKALLGSLGRLDPAFAANPRQQGKAPSYALCNVSGG